MKYNLYKILQNKKGQERDTNTIYEIMHQSLFYEIRLP